MFVEDVSSAPVTVWPSIHRAPPCSLHRPNPPISVDVRKFTRLSRRIVTTQSACLHYRLGFIATVRVHTFKLRY